MDVADIDENKINEAIENAELAHDRSTLTFIEPRLAMSSLDAFTAAIFAEARSMVDWNQRNKACFGILRYRRYMLKHNKSTRSVLLVVHPYIHCGLDGSCAARLYFPGSIMQTRNLVPPGLSIHCIEGNNHCIAHPRTDPVVIVVAIDQSGEKILLGRNVRTHRLQ